MTIIRPDNSHHKIGRRHPSAITAAVIHHRQTTKTTLLFFVFSFFSCLIFTNFTKSSFLSSLDAPLQVNIEPKHHHRPLSPLQLSIVARPQPINLTFINVTNISNDYKKHPHKGAKDEKGKWGYIHDEMALRRNPPEFNLLEDGEQIQCEEGEEWGRSDDDYRMLTEKVKVFRERKKEKVFDSVKIFCTVYTTDSNHDVVNVIRQTWGHKCDGFMVASNRTDPSLQTVHIPHSGAEHYLNLWQKLRSIYAYVYDTYYHKEKYDFYFFGGDDTYVIVENLRHYLNSEEIRMAVNGGIHPPHHYKFSHQQTPLYLGRRFAQWGDRNLMFNGGGPGYVLNRAALKGLVVDVLPRCETGYSEDGEDVVVARCLRMGLDVVPYDTKDEEGGERFMPFDPAHHLSFYDDLNVSDTQQDWYLNFSIDIKFGFDHCSKHSISFHYIDKRLMKKIHAILYNLCEKKKKR